MINEKNNIFPKVDDGSIYPEITKFINKSKFCFDIGNLPTVKKIEKLSNSKFFKIADCVLNVRDNFPNSRRSFIDGPEYDGRLVDYVPEQKYESLWFREQKEWIYILAYNGHVVKIGMTSSGMSSRYGSYGCGTKKAMKKGSCATTNFVVSQSNYFALCSGIKVEVFAHEIPENWTNIEIFGVTQTVLNKVAHKYESTLIDIHKKKFGHIPPLCGAYGPT
jgi:hypothetical protein